MGRRVMREMNRFVAFDNDGGKHIVLLLQQLVETVSTKGIKVKPTSKIVHQLSNADLVVPREGHFFEVVRTRELLRRP